MSGEGAAGVAESRRKEIYKYTAPWPIYGMNWSQKKSKPMRLAIGSFVEEYTNKVKVIELDQEKGAFKQVAQVDHPYPTTKIMWLPDVDDKIEKDLFATTGDYLRVWKIGEDGKKTTMECLLNNNKSSDFCAPLTSFDWNETEPNLIGTSSIDTTCTIWDLTVSKPIGATSVSGEVKTQLIAHDMEVYDIAWAKGINIFASVGADGSVRMFDLRNLEHSNIMYENENTTQLLRLAWNQQDSNYLATMEMDSSSVFVLDIRVPMEPVAVLERHEASVNGVAWAPHSSCHMCTAGDDQKAFIWDISSMPDVEPILAYDAAGPINQINWSKADTDWVAIAHDQTVEALRV
mmetsp:Transcript_107022/g.149212  ORF Transcript_107022/g.149212 Transcript_107022/m.149212 type:complete len:347 (+) Transcript_107022:84-1124(+)